MREGDRGIGGERGGEVERERGRKRRRDQERGGERWRERGSHLVRFLANVAKRLSA